MYGIGTAATHYFGAPGRGAHAARRRRCSPGIVKSPAAYDPTRNPNDSVARRDVVLARMRDVGVITEARARRRRGEPR